MHYWNMYLELRSDMQSDIFDSSDLFIWIFDMSMKLLIIRIPILWPIWIYRIFWFIRDSPVRMREPINYYAFVFGFTSHKLSYDLFSEHGYWMWCNGECTRQFIATHTRQPHWSRLSEFNTNKKDKKFHHSMNIFNPFCLIINTNVYWY